MIDEAKAKADSANNTVANTMDKLNKIREEINKISVTPANSSLSNVFNDVDQSGEFSNFFRHLSMFFSFHG